MLCIFSHVIMNSVCQCVFELMSAQIPALAPLSVLCTRISAIRCWTWPLIKLTPVRHASKYSLHISTHQNRKDEGGLEEEDFRKWEKGTNISYNTLMLPSLICPWEHMSEVSEQHWEQRHWSKLRARRSLSKHDREQKGETESVIIGLQTDRTERLSWIKGLILFLVLIRGMNIESDLECGVRCVIPLI